MLRIDDPVRTCEFAVNRDVLTAQCWRGTPVDTLSFACPHEAQHLFKQVQTEIRQVISWKQVFVRTRYGPQRYEVSARFVVASNLDLRPFKEGNHILLAGVSVV